MEKENTESVFTTGRGTVIAVISAEARAKARTLSEIIDKEIKEDPLFQAAVKCDLEEVEAEQNEPLKVSEDTVGSSGVKRPREPLDNESPEDAVDLNAVRTPDVKKAKSRKFGGFKTPRPVPKVPSSVPVGTNTLADLSPLAQDFRVKNTAESALPTPFPPVQETKQHGSSLYIQSPATLLSRISLSTPEEAKQNSASHTFSPAELNDIEEISRMCLNEDFYLDSIDAVPEALTEPQKSFKSLSEAEKLEVEECARLCFEDIL